MKQLELSAIEVAWIRHILKDAIDFAEKGFTTFESNLLQVKLHPQDCKVDIIRIKELLRKLNETT